MFIILSCYPYAIILNYSIGILMNPILKHLQTMKVP